MDNQAQKPINQSQPQEQIPDQRPKPVQSSSKTLWYVVGGLVVLVVLGGLYFTMKKQQVPSQTTQQPVITQIPTIQPKPTLPRSKPLGTIANVVVATSIDAQGNAVSPASSFLVTQKSIYLVLMLNNAKLGTKIEYVRYLNGKYLDSSSLKIIKPNATNASFVWVLSKPGAKHLVGTYRVKTYTNGVFEKEITYSVQ